jgi:hypothetical protein
MGKTKMLSFRLDSALLRKIDLLQISRHKTRGEIIREAVELYFSVHNPLKAVLRSDQIQESN